MWLEKAWEDNNMWTLKVLLFESAAFLLSSTNIPLPMFLIREATITKIWSRKSSRKANQLICWIEMLVRAVASVVWCACVGVWWKDGGTVSMQAQYVRLQLKRHEQLWHCLPLKCVHVQCVLINSSVLNASGNMNIRWMVRSVKLLLTSLSLVRERSPLDVRQRRFERKRLY